MNPALFANPQIFGAYQQDPRLGYAQALMQQGASTAPVRSPLEGLARALTAGVGGYQAGSVRRGYQAQDEKYRQGLAAALQGQDVLGALTQSNDPYLQQMGLQQELELNKTKQAAKYQLANDLASKGLMLNPDGSVTKMQGFGNALGGVENEKTIATIPGEVQKQKALIPGEVDKAVQVAQGTMPIDVQKAAAVAQATAPIEQQKQIDIYNATQGPQQKMQNAEKLRDDVAQNQDIKNYRTMLPVYKSMVEAAGQNNRAADLNLVYGMAKLFDPTSVVREGEQVLVRDTASLPSELVGMINKLNGGAALQPETRRNLLQQASSRVKTSEAQYNQAIQFYSNLAQNQGLNPKDVLYDIGPSPVAPGSSGGPQGPRVLIYNPQTGKMEPQ